MEPPELKLVAPVAARRGAPAAALLGCAVLTFAAWGTWRGADRARRPFDPAALAESALARTLATGDPAPAEGAVEALRTRLRAAPLDAATRTVAASLAAETAMTPEERSAAAVQAQTATRLVRSDEWIAAGAARVLARCGRPDLALDETARMFAYAPNEAAATLVAVEPWVEDGALENGLPATPSAWLAWSVRLRQSGREREADERLAALLARWPSDLKALGTAAGVAASRGRLDELRRLVPASLTLPDAPEAATLHAFRARSKAEAGDAAGAHADAIRAVDLARGDPWVMALAGDAIVASRPAEARDYWTRALYRLLEQSPSRNAVTLRARLARLNDREGRARDALREWRAVLADRPDDVEAATRIADLTGVK